MNTDRTMTDDPEAVVSLKLADNMQSESALSVCCSSPKDIEEKENNNCIEKELEYRVSDVPAFHLCFLFGLQQVLLSISSIISIPLIVSDKICVGQQDLATSEIMSTFLFMCGVCTLLQCTIGVRLPIIQGGCHKFIPAIAALMSLDIWKCPEGTNSMDNWSGDNNNSIIDNTSTTGIGYNHSLGFDKTEVWQVRMREIQGGIMLASLTQILLGATGLLGYMIRFIGPLTIVPTITLVGLSLIDVSLSFCEKHWGIAALTLFLVVLFSLYLRNIDLPMKVYNRKEGCVSTSFPMFKVLPVILAVAVSWLVCGILTATDVLPTDPKSPQYQARTDAKENVINISKWFFFPYPGQWGLPTVSLASYAGMMAATLTSIIESVGDYYACARISGEPPPPSHAVNRGIAIEGFGSLISGAVGSGGATTSYSQNIGSIGFMKVASRRAFQAAGVIFILCGVIGKFGAILTMMPQPILGGIVVISFGMVTSVGLSNLQFVQMSSGRNMCIIGLSLLLGLMIPKFLGQNPHAINTGSSGLDQVITLLLSTAMFVGGFIGFVLDNTVPGTREERGLLKWNQILSDIKLDDDEESNSKRKSTYDLPYITNCLWRHKVFSFFPFLPTFTANSMSCRRKKMKMKCQPV